MAMRDIPRAEWRTFFERFARQHQHESVTVVKTGVRDGLRIAERAVPLIDMTHDPATHRISVKVGDPPFGEVTHSVVEPDGVTFAEPLEADEDPQVSIHLTSGDQQLVVRLERAPVHA